MSDLLIDGLALIKAWAVGFFVHGKKGNLSGKF